jgi:hypothetical protein
VKQPLLLLLILLVEGFYWDQSSSMILLHSRQGKAKQAKQVSSKAACQLSCTIAAAGLTKTHTRI